MSSPFGPRRIDRPPAIAPTDNLFFALLPDRAAQHRAWLKGHALQARYGLPGYRTPFDCLHVSLVPLGPGFAITHDLLDRAMAAASAAATSGAPFLLEFNRAESWNGRPRPRVLTGEDGLIGAHRLQERLCLALGQRGIDRKAAANFRPHLTLMRDHVETPVEFIEPLGWWVREVVLVQSHVGEGRYTILGRWRLG